MICHLIDFIVDYRFYMYVKMVLDHFVTDCMIFSSPEPKAQR